MAPPDFGPAMATVVMRVSSIVDLKSEGMLQVVSRLFIQTLDLNSAVPNLKRRGLHTYLVRHMHNLVACWDFKGASASAYL
jgi:hypothetical protein